MKKTIFFFAVALTILHTQNCFARPRGRYYNNNNYYYNKTTNSQYVQSYTSSNSSYDNSSAQGVAETMARLNRVGHFGGHHPYYEGCGSGFSRESAYNNCCYANSGMQTVDVGYAQGPNGMWFCCRRYR